MYSARISPVNAKARCTGCINGSNMEFKDSQSIYYVCVCGVPYTEEEGAQFCLCKTEGVQRTLSFNTDYAYYADFMNWTPSPVTKADIIAEVKSLMSVKPIFYTYTLPLHLRPTPLSPENYYPS